ncbi:MAG: thiamine phosphate synthase [Planctomycetota bacterium]
MAGFLTAVFVTDDGSDLAETLEVAGCALRGGATAIVVRRPRSTARDVFELTRQLRPATRRLGCMLIVHDRIDVAVAADADGVHLSSRSVPVAAARRVSGNLKIGYSVHNLDEVGQAEESGVDYVFLGSVFPTRSHPEGQPLGIEAFQEAALRTSIEICAIGGIDVNNVGEIANAGGRGAAAIRAYYESDDPAETARAFRAAFGT